MTQASKNRNSWSSKVHKLLMIHTTTDTFPTNFSNKSISVVITTATHSHGRNLRKTITLL